VTIEPVRSLVATHSTSGVGVLEKAMSVLNIVSAAALPMTFTELLRAGNLPKATLHRILATLMREGLLRFVPGSKTYQLGFRLLELAHEVWSDFDLRLAAQDEIANLRNSLGMSVHLAVLDRDSMVVVASQDADRDARRGSLVGTRWPVHATAVGKIVLAYLEPQRRAEVLASVELVRLTPATCTTHAAFYSELDLSHARGYAIDNREHETGMLSVAAPILDIQGRPIGAVAVSAAADQVDSAQLHAWSSTVMAAARTIAHNAGGDFMSLQPHMEPAPDAGPEVRCVTQCASLLGEGPIWSPRDGVLYWVDILTPSVHWHDTRTGSDHEVKLGSMVSVAIPKETGGLIVATSAGLMTMDTASKTLEPLCHPEADRPGNRYNDGKCDRMGRLWIGSLDMGTAANRGNLFRVDPDGSWIKMDGGFSVANGLGWSPDNRQMYFTDSARRVIYVYDFDLLTGTVTNRRPFITIDPSDGTPDGLTVDEDGCLWVAIWDSWRIARYSPQGREMLRIRMPVPRPTSCCFGGANLDTLYVTSASLRLNQQALEAAPLSGSLFSLRIPGVRGLPETPFAG
jgi:sugar lactone lactonase YvrE/DNA-binding IclR family transcriptional regulator